MELISIRIISDNVKQLVGFYEQVTGLSPIWYTDEFAEVKTSACTLAIASTRTIEMFGSSAAHAADNHTAIIEFRVDDVDKEYDRLKSLVKNFVKEPTTQPWGNRSMLFRDPDGNLLNFFTAVSADAVKKFDE